MLLVYRLQQRRNQTGPVVAPSLSSDVADMRTATTYCSNCRNIAEFDQMSIVTRIIT